MSRRAPNPAAERAAQNQATIKSLLKLETNKICADCKRNKHPRWASWNLGIFICIRCSGIHRGMGTHISRVKSVDLDSWTDEQLQSVVRWGNARANKYWEAKLAAGHAPSEAKIENFIRTKYELKRWTMDGPMPDPSTLDEGGGGGSSDDIMAGRGKEKQAEPANKAQASPRPVADLIGGVDPIPQQRTGPPVAKVTPKAEPAPPKTTGTKDSLLGLDLFGSPSAPPRPASTTGFSSGAQSRPDLKQSILSLYASSPKPQPPQQQQGHQQQGSLGGFSDAFGSLSVASPSKPAPVDPFASLGSTVRSPQSSSSSGAFGLGGGGFFESSKPAHQSKPSSSSFGAFPSPTSPVPAPTKPASAMDDLFDFSTTSSTTAATATTAQPPMQSTSVFNLSAPQAKPAAPSPTSTAAALGTTNLSGADVWGANEWASGGARKPEATPKAGSAGAAGLGWGVSFASTPIVAGTGGGFGAAPKVAADEEFGGWTSSTETTTTTTTTAAAAPSKGFGEAGDDLFSNVWQ